MLGSVFGVRVNVRCLWLGNGVNLRFEGWNLGSVLALGARFRVCCLVKGSMLGIRVNTIYRC